MFSLTVKENLAIKHLIKKPTYKQNPIPSPPLPPTTKKIDKKKTNFEKKRFTNHNVNS